MITFAQLQADPSNMELGNAYAAQQGNILNAQGGTGPSQGSPNLTQGQQYLAAHPDVFNNAVARANDEGIFGGDAFSSRLDEIALEHFNAFGVADGRAGFGYTPPATGTFAPSPNETPSFNSPSTNINPGTGQPFTPAPGQTGLGSNNGQSQQSTFDNSGYQTALNNFGGLLNNYGDFFGGLLSGAQNAQDQSNMNPYSAYPNANYVNPWNATAPMGVNSVFGANNSMSGLGNLAGGVASGGWNSGSSWNGGGGAANTGHNMLWTT